MRLAVARTSEGTRVVLDTGREARFLQYSDLGEALRAGAHLDPDAFDGEPVADVEHLELAPVAGAHAKVVCVGHNFRQHILEMGHELPEYPNVFCKFVESLVGPSDAIHLSSDVEQWDWEAELAVVIGKAAYRVDEADAADYVAGYTTANDISARDWQRRTSQWLLGKSFEQTTPVGPWLVTPDQVDPSDGLTLTCSVDGVEKQRSTTSDLLFGPLSLVAYISRVFTLQPGDLILTGTPGGVGAARDPVERLQPGQQVITEIVGLGRLTNECVSADQPLKQPTKGRP
jgi:acylpyruvate hydrolase